MMMMMMIHPSYLVDSDVRVVVVVVLAADVATSSRLSFG